MTCTSLKAYLPARYAAPNEEAHRPSSCIEAAYVPVILLEEAPYRPAFHMEVANMPVILY
jgi:hypothetical protein